MILWSEIPILNYTKQVFRELLSEQFVAGGYDRRSFFSDELSITQLDLQGSTLIADVVPGVPKEKGSPSEALE